MYYQPNRKEMIDSLNKIRDGLTPIKNEQSIATPFKDEHKYELTQKEIEFVFNKQVYKDIIKSEAFQRLKNIHFLGSIDYVINPKATKLNKRHTRYQHSLGVARLALQYAKDKQLTEKEEILCVVSALLHDIGHAPLSHSLETVFKEEFGISHHLSGERIIKGDEPIGYGLSKLFSKWNINPFELLIIIEGKGASPYREIFSYSINIDTIEGILRSSTYIYENELFATPSHILYALLHTGKDATRVLDNFWLLKGEIYSRFINSRQGVIADYMCQKYMRDNSDSFKASYYYGYEKNLRKKHAGLFRRLRYLAVKPEHELLPDVDEVPFYKRNFIINSEIEIDGVESINKRYTQSKNSSSYKILKKEREGKHEPGSNQNSYRLFE